MRSSLIGLTVAVLISTGVFSCKRVKPQPPAATTLDSSLAVPVSTITIPIHYDINRLELMVNTKVKGVFLREKFKVNEKKVYCKKKIKSSVNTTKNETKINVLLRLKKKII